MSPLYGSTTHSTGEPIYCIGDSHVSFFAGSDVIQPVWPQRSQDQLPWFRTFHIGPVLAFSLSRAGTSTRGREQLFDVLESAVPKGARVLLCFGEIDCRAHLLKQVARQGRGIEQVVADCLDAYFSLVAELQARGYAVIVYNAVPTRLSAPRKAKRDDDYVAVGSWQQRNAAVRLFNAGAQQRCAAMGLTFLDTYSAYVDQNDRTVEWYFFDTIHLSQRGMPAALRALSTRYPNDGYPDSPLPNPSVLQQFLDRFLKRLRRILKLPTTPVPKTHRRES